jgi:hypothetical protein
MKKILRIATVLVIGLINIETYATEEDEHIQQECEKQIDSYGITDIEEYQQMLTDCIDSMSTENPIEQYESENLPADQG